ncbi:hypothetical protein EPUS_04076 [Endocarpon pusillum Z07020]|uniref:Peptidase S54 rhomboid domain-containing protein n=1 Tax=Endocarpon pusillum (strain Z07020 / HMAS-L-300199) TaxID=1263415 RepID=U1GMG1_ENDPU|nr:uncharacterized protein EPUS_04076 [Endocarpon pusillum Z07020]ERF73453.1 hypothetical protein EPUS_04076 [Endocarpon pusillum Z07020]
MSKLTTPPRASIITYSIPTWITPLVIAVVTSILIPPASLLGHLCACAVGYAFGLGYLKILAPPDKILRWIEAKLNLLGRLPHYVSIDQKTYGRYGVLPSTVTSSSTATGPPADHAVAMGWLGTGGGGQRLGP